MSDATQKSNLPGAVIKDIAAMAGAETESFMRLAQAWPKVAHHGQSRLMGNFVPHELLDYVPYDWEESASKEGKAYGLLSQMQPETEEAMRLQGACLARENIVKAV
jgi:hypothetical protein